eukprot:CAMPEP_0175898164 /NCGR_PEP_ID=MMETSP0108-20121206/1109_1 /TAXON_ID=195067 ORGANISM="Goniomonas pacifica, Strain CCMP1869" /NCGR_SAMPLE_ID=MMETSP0108 /ASSEMBLY_ACC=CAM_ASM_000204 /LENGTH=186 /DNA_ID=CAMNT_0017219515 /DNA_START=1 /DNA_END=561 /DNA_ORIENTATION=+
MASDFQVHRRTRDAVGVGNISAVPINPHVLYPTTYQRLGRDAQLAFTLDSITAPRTHHFTKTFDGRRVQFRPVSASEAVRPSPESQEKREKYREFMRDDREKAHESAIDRLRRKQEQVRTGAGRPRTAESKETARLLAATRSNVQKLAEHRAWLRKDALRRETDFLHSLVYQTDANWCTGRDQTIR